MQVRDTETGLVETNNLKEEPEDKAKVVGEVSSIVCGNDCLR